MTISTPTGDEIELPLLEDFVQDSVDYKNRPSVRSKSGCWKSSAYIIGDGVAERFVYFGISLNLVSYLTGSLGQSTASAASLVNGVVRNGVAFAYFGCFRGGLFHRHNYSCVCALRIVSAVTANLNNIPVLNGTNFGKWKEHVMIVLGVMDMDHALRFDCTAALTDESTDEEKAAYAKWERTNRMSLMIMKHSIPESIRGGISEEAIAKDFLKQLSDRFTASEKVETSTILSKLTSMKYKGKGNIREYIMEMSNLVTRLRALRLDMSEDILVHLILISLPAHFSPFKISYNTQREKWTLNELIAQCVQEEERLKQEKTESAYLASASNDGNAKKRKRKDKGKKTADPGTSQHKEQKKQDQGLTCFFCRKAGHLKKDCSKYAGWRVKKGKLLNFVCSEVNLSMVPSDTWWIDTGATTHISVTLQDCLSYREPIDGERYIYVGNGNKAEVVAVAKNWRATPVVLSVDEEALAVLSQESTQFKFLEKALIAPRDVSIEDGKFCSIGDVEDAKSILRLVPIWFTALGYGIIYAQPSTLFTKQATTMDPFVERKRLATAVEFGLVDKPNVMIPMSAWWFAPQYVLAGIADVFAMIGLQEFFYEQVSCDLKSIGLAMYLNILGIGSLLSSFLVSLIENVTTRHGHDGWFANNLNRAHLDYFYWLLTGISVLGLAAYIYFARSYVCRRRSHA
ncbi:hypothetical protein RD792_011096 [Penstemon davidsonii]|uniref:CCHC-type domain-containing protein n=1 Tax=Penstemon davidsonii TaxID=160366 RepID=A0ABR0D3U9_9LAMI|nr:hypothetical protein RD792_011096 [Penstemon davidsonii]